MDDPYRSVTSYRDQFKQLKDLDQAKDVLIEQLLSRLETLSSQYSQEIMDHDREKQFNRDFQLREFQLKEEFRKNKSFMERNPFLLVLIDGDGMIFQDSLLQKAEQGGKDAAGLLYTAVHNYIQGALLDPPPDVKIVARVYANVKGLAEACFKAGIVDKPSKVEDFARGFTRSKHLFDFVDVGTGKDRADDKLSEVFKVHLYDCHCRQILFGCSHDNGYARLLEDFISDSAAADRISLLEGVPFERELDTLRAYFKTTKFPGLFRESKVKTFMDPPLARTISSSTTNSTYALSWSSAAALPAPYQASPPAPVPIQPTLSPNEVPRNRKGQRVDPEVKYDKNDVKRMKALKLCNVHFLRGDCYYEDCTHEHSYQIKPAELATLQYIGRMAPCRMGVACDDPKCIYGHRCPGNPCIFGSSCRFPEELHRIDETIVRFSKV
ncbi:MAG: hypothetical protein M1829_002859 [Trizodia sp. TS-e1964]|nr:MAG: hypothetical protein M1829_002859 [Trizodia sp. TS-e1964]